MGTRSLTHIFSNDKEVACIYRQMDGYPEAHGHELAEFLASGKFVNGLSFGDHGKRFNGMGCFAAQLVGALKGGEAGGIYLYPTASSDVGEEYVYEIRGGNDYADDGRPKPATVKVLGYGSVMYEGDIAGFAKFCVEPREEDEGASA